jgi:chaperonin cofactor prefoldin
MPQRIVEHGKQILKIEIIVHNYQFAMEMNTQPSGGISDRALEYTREQSNDSFDYQYHLQQQIVLQVKNQKTRQLVIQILILILLEISLLCNLIIGIIQLTLNPNTNNILQLVTCKIAAMKFLYDLVLKVKSFKKTKKTPVIPTAVKVIGHPQYYMETPLAIPADSIMDPNQIIIGFALLANSIDNVNNNLNNRMDRLEVRIEEVNQNLNARMDRLEVRIEEVNQNLTARMDKLEVRMDKLEVRMDKLEVRMDKLEVRMDKLEVRMDKLEVRMESMENTLKNVLEVMLDIQSRLPPRV